jgi:hypothetical protein
MKSGYRSPAAQHPPENFPARLPVVQRDMPCSLSICFIGEAYINFTSGCVKNLVEYF